MRILTLFFFFPFQFLLLFSFLGLSTDRHFSSQFHVSSILLRLGVLYFQMNLTKEGEESLLRAIELRSKKNGPNHSSVADAKHVLEGTLWTLPLTTWQRGVALSDADHFSEVKKPKPQA